jgi:hypothetical protein
MCVRVLHEYLIDVDVLNNNLYASYHQAMDLSSSQGSHSFSHLIGATSFTLQISLVCSMVESQVSLVCSWWSLDI